MTLRAAAFAIVVAAGLWSGGGGVAAAAPERVVSTHLCADVLLLLLADRSQIASLSYFATDGNFTTEADAAQGLPLNHGLAEEILPLAPDLVFAGAFAARPLSFLLRRQNIPVVDLPLADSFEEIRRNIRLVAGLLGTEARGARLIAAFDAALPPAAAPDPTPPVVALYWSKGYTPASASLAGAAARHVGFVDLGQALGLDGAARVSLETLLLADPALLAKAGRDAAALADLPLAHPALRGAFKGPRTVTIPDKLWVCGAPSVADAAWLMSDARKRLAP